MNNVRLAWTSTDAWDCRLDPVAWARLVEEMSDGLPTDASDESVATVRRWLRDNPQDCEEVLSALEYRRASSCVDSGYTLDLAFCVDDGLDSGQAAS